MKLSKRNRKEGLVYTDKGPQLERSVSLFPISDLEMNDKHIASSDLLRNTKEEPGFDELESIVRIKQAEANMFQSRADDARREADSQMHCKCKK
ncbi:hypothetical protein AgCh_025680 [Apium graveolens]